MHAGKALHTQPHHRPLVFNIYESSLKAEPPSSLSRTFSKWVGRSSSARHSQHTEPHLWAQVLASEPTPPQVSDIRKSPVRMRVLAGDSGLEEMLLEKHPGSARERCGWSARTAEAAPWVHPFLKLARPRASHFQRSR